MSDEPVSDEHGRGTRSYRTGDWFGIFGDHATVLLPPTEKARVAELWELVDDGAGFDEVLDALITSGLRELPGFVLVSESDGETRVVLRGDARAGFTTGEGYEELDGSIATTWVERSLHGVARMEIHVADEAEGVDHTIAGGLVRVARVDAPPYRPEPSGGGAHAADPVLAADGNDGPDTGSIPVPGPRSSPPPGPPVGRPPGPPVGPPVGLPVGPPQGPPAGPPVGPPVGPPTGPPVGPPTGPPTGAPIDPPIEPLRGPLAATDPDDDHDGMTQAGGWDPEELAPQQPGIPGQPPAPAVTRAVARLRFSSGEDVEVDRTVLVGRAPEARGFTSAELPRLVTVPSPNQEISSTHIEIRPGSGADHGSAVVTDLGSTNGTVVVQPGLPPEELQPGTAVQLVPGAVIDLGDGVTIQVSNP